MSGYNRRESRVAVEYQAWSKEPNSINFFTIDIVREPSVPSLDNVPISNIIFL